MRGQNLVGGVSVPRVFSKEEPMDVPALPHAANLRWGRFSQPGGAYHITKCRHKNARLSLADDLVAPILVESIRWHQENRHTHLLAFVVMPDHVHWLFVLGGNRSLKEVMYGFSSFIWNQIIKAHGQPTGALWEAEYHDHQLRTEERAWETIQYIHENPVRGGLCACAEDWPWSTANTRYRDWIEEEHILGE